MYCVCVKMTSLHGHHSTCYTSVDERKTREPGSPSPILAKNHIINIHFGIMVYVSLQLVHGLQVWPQLGAVSKNYWVVLRTWTNVLLQGAIKCRGELLQRSAACIPATHCNHTSFIWQQQCGLLWKRHHPTQCMDYHRLHGTLTTCINWHYSHGKISTAYFDTLRA